MKTALRLISCACLLAASALAQATTYTFSYSFLDTSLVSGSFDGVANGDLITNLSHIAVNVNGLDFTGNIASTSVSNVGFSPAVVSISGTHNDFFFIDASNNVLYSGAFLGHGTTDAISYVTTDGLNGEGGDGSDDRLPTYSAARWNVTAAAVPEPASYAMLLAGLGLVSMVARRRRSTAG